MPLSISKDLEFSLVKHSMCYLLTSFTITSSLYTGIIMKRKHSIFIVKQTGKKPLGFYTNYVIKDQSISEADGKVIVTVEML